MDDTTQALPIGTRVRITGLLVSRWGTPINLRDAIGTVQETAPDDAVIEFDNGQYVLLSQLDASEWEVVE